MRLCIPIEHRPEGGVYTFVGNFRSYLDAHGIPHTADLDDAYDVLFVNSWVVPYETVRRAKESHPSMRVVQRVDGSSQNYGGYRAGDQRQACVNLLADLTIFQSHYSKVSTTSTYRVVHQDGPIIHNPVDLELFRPDGPHLTFAPGRVRVACASWSTNPNKGTADLALLASAHPDIDFVLCGRFEGVPFRPNVLRFGHLSRADMAQAMRSCDVFLNVSEKDSAPNVVLEALASGLPVLYRDSGGVPELVGECGAVCTVESFRAQLDALLARREALGRAARDRATREFAPHVIFPRYLQAMASATRRPLPRKWDVLMLAAKGFPVLRAAITPLKDASPARAVAARQPSKPARSRSRPYRVGWTTYDSFFRPKRDFDELDPSTGMRAGNIARWINAHDDGVRVELFDPRHRYDIVVFQKVMDRRARREVQRLRAAGTMVVFDANVNYYEIWGDYPIPGTKPTDQLRRDAIWMTEQADWVVADSSYLASVAGKYTSRVSWIPDNVNLDTYSGTRQHHGQRADKLKLVWSGISKKAAHLGLIVEVLPHVPDIELVIVTDDPDSHDVQAIARVVPSSVQTFSDSGYARTLADCDVIISPKYLINGYEMGHTEYKITLGMAVGLPAVASPQPSYVEAIGHLGGGIVARTPHEWLTALTCLVESAERRAAMGDLARRTVRERYSTPVVARQYLDLLDELTGRSGRAAVATAC